MTVLHRIFRRTTLSLLTCIAGIVALFVAEVIWIPRFIDAVVSTFPETSLLRSPSLFWQGVVITCWQCALAIGPVLLYRNKEKTNAMMVWRRLRVGFLVIAGGLIMAGDISIGLMGFGTPGFAYAMLIASLASFTSAYFLR